VIAPPVGGDHRYETNQYQYPTTLPSFRGSVAPERVPASLRTIRAPPNRPEEHGHVVAAPGEFRDRRDQGVEGALARFEAVGVIGSQRDGGPAVLQRDAGLAHDHAARRGSPVRSDPEGEAR
jgi:hypothetical protein